MAMQLFILQFKQSPRVDDIEAQSILRKVKLDWGGVTSLTSKEIVLTCSWQRLAQTFESY